MVLIEVPMIFFGSHNTNPKVTSLHMRISQIVYRPKVYGECRVIPLLKSFDNSDSISDTNKTDVKSSRKRSVNKKVKKSASENLQDVIDSISVSP